MPNRKEKPEWMTNRQQTRDARTKKLSWCNRCDRDLVHRGGKCGTCGGRDLPRRDKKAGPKE